MQKFLLLLLSTLFFLSCTTIPIPENEKDSLAILLTEFQKETDKEVFGSYVFTISHTKSDYKKNIIIYRNKTYFLTGLRPGKYNVSYKFVYDSGKMGTNNDLFSFQIKEGKATIIPKKIIVHIYNNDKGGASMCRRSEAIPEIKTVKEKLLNKHPELNDWIW